MRGYGFVMQQIISLTIATMLIITSHITSDCIIYHLYKLTFAVYSDESQDEVKERIITLYD